MSFKTARRLEAIDAELAALNAEKESLDALFNSGEVIDDVEAKAARYSEIKDIIDALEMEWLELQEQ